MNTSASLSNNQLDHAACERARLARDPRFDGRFFIAVKTTGIYCRTVCPVRLPKPENVTFYPSTAAASEQGYRPCLRCRPELAPSNPYWPQHPPLLRAALELIDQGELDDGEADQRGVEGLAAKLGISDRHLRRLFSQHLGASPKALAQTRRALFAKRLVSDSQMPLKDISQAAGYANVRRFNAAFSKIYKCPPSDLRKKKRVSQPTHDDGFQLDLAYREPYNWPQIQVFLARRALFGIETVDADSYSRNIFWQGHAGTLRLQHIAAKRCFQLRLNHPKASALYPLAQRCKQLLDLEANSVEIAETLQHAPHLAASFQNYPGLRIPGCWDRFELCVRAIIGQQVSVAAACTLTQRVVQRCNLQIETADGPLLMFPDAHTISHANLDQLGLTGRRIATLKALSNSVLSGELDLYHCNHAAICTGLLNIPGIGPWTLAYFAMRALKDPDAFPQGDIVLRKAVSSDNTAVSAETLLQMSQAWRPWRAYAVMALWLKTNTLPIGETS